jgi:hypothetical protein
LVLDFSTTGHATSTTAGNAGTEIKSGDDARTLVGMIYVWSDGNFYDNSNNRTCSLSWFNRRNRYLRSATSSPTTTSTGAIELSTALRVYFLTWGDEAVHSSVTGSYSNNSGSYWGFVGTNLDNTTDLSPNSLGTPMGANAYMTMNASSDDGVSEGYHFLTVRGAVAAGTGTFGSMATNGMIRG